MVNRNKTIEKLKINHKALRYLEIEKLFTDNELFIVRYTKSSHRVIVRKSNGKFVTIPYHDNDCKPYYKGQLKKLYFNEKL